MVSTHWNNGVSKRNYPNIAQYIRLANICPEIMFIYIYIEHCLVSRSMSLLRSTDSEDESPENVESFASSDEGGKRRGQQTRPMQGCYLMMWAFP